MKLFIALFVIVAAVISFSCNRNQKDAQLHTKTTEKLPEDAEEANKPDAEDWSLAAIENSKLKFRNGKVLDTKLADLHFIGQISAENQPPYFLYSGRYCSECDARQMLYLANAKEPMPDVSFGKNRLMHPGIMRDYQTGEALYKARTFYGNVLDNTTGIIWYQESLSDYGTYIPNIFLIKLHETGSTDTSFAFNNSYLKQTLALFDKGACKEVKGVEYLSEP